MAILDWWAQKKKITVSNLLNVDRGKLKATSFTIGISNIGEIAQKIEEAKPYKILKVKLGTENFLENSLATELLKSLTPERYPKSLKFLTRFLPQ